jgi:hypothetical protein
MPWRLLTLIAVLFSTGRVFGNVFVVTNTNDSGPGSLREAITEANAHPNSTDGEFIHFNIPGPGVHTIVLESALPDISEGVSVDGSSQPGTNGTPLVELTAAPGLAADGLRITGGSTTIFFLTINGFQNGIYIGPAGDNHIFGCYIGTDNTGTQAAPNDRGILVNQAGHNEIGDGPAGLRNIISGNRLEGIKVSQFDPNSVDNVTIAIRGNYIGTDVTGTQAVPNGTANATGGHVAAAVDVFCRGAEIGGPVEYEQGNLVSGNLASGISVGGTNAVVAGNFVGTTASGSAALPNHGAGILLHFGGGTVGGIAPRYSNLVSGNTGAGIVVDSDGGTIQGNRIGTDITGKFALPNYIGVVISASQHNVIGGNGFDLGNVISGNLSSGIAFAIVANFPGLNEVPPTDNIVLGNFIGTDITGMTALPNGGDGVTFFPGDIFGAARNRIGGTAASARNVISGNLGNGIFLDRRTANFIQGNLIGVAVDGQTPLGNGQNGILVTDAFSNKVGAVAGANEAAGNTIAFNLRNGIAVKDSRNTPVAQRISANSIHDNGRIGLDLNDDGVTPNDTSDPDVGANGLQNFPVIGSAFGFNGSLSIYGTINTEPSRSFTLEFFANSGPAGAGLGESQIFLGQANVATNSSGDASFNVTFPLPPNVATVSATAIDSSGNTSEFAAAASISFTAPSPPPVDPTPVILPTHASQLLNISARLRVEVGDHVPIAGFIITGGVPRRVIVRGIGPSLSPFGVPGVLADPVLSLFGEAEFIARNDNWMSDQQAEIEKTGIAPANPLESAMVQTLEPGGYTAVLTGKDGTTGVGIVEVYDLAATGDSRLGNLGMRGFVGTGDDAMIAGLIVGGNGGGGTTVVVKVIGPSFAPGSIPDPLADPTLELRNANGALLDSNDDWRSSNGADAIRAAGLAPQNDREPALSADVFPGNYTAIVRGKGNAVGVALVEVYDIGH